MRRGDPKAQDSFVVGRLEAIAPVTPQLVARLMGALILPMLPLLLFEFSLGDLSRQLFKHFAAN